MTHIPRHVAIIMDRNGEWAKQRGLPRSKGHIEGVAAVERVVEAAGELGVEVLSLFAFSTENWLRPKDEVSFLMKLLDSFIKKEARKLTKNGVRLVVSGRNERIPANVQRSVEGVVAESATNTKLTLNICLDYGGMDEIARAAAKLAQAAIDGRIKPEEINEARFAAALDQPLPAVDLLIRTGGEQRISNFMLWQCAYAEFHFSHTLWPDFGKAELATALEDFATRKRRFGMTDEQ
jgi:undecaprenyl diphosphate synthase